MVDPAEELIQIVDVQNKVTGSATRGEMRKKNLVHRASYILVLNSAGEIFVQKRTTSKDVFPGYYDVAAGGVVLAGESYEDSAVRELHEELGVTAPLVFRFDHFYGSAVNRVWGRIFTCVHEGPMTLQETEVESGQFMNVASVQELSRKEPFTPDGIEILERCIKKAVFQSSEK